jgi:tRNA threonylcarbamoyl adenosine modification protein YeaZ
LGFVVNVLAIETATTACAIGVMTNDHSVSVVLDRDRHHTEVLTAGIMELLASEHLDVAEIDRIVVDRGPGLFTGLRVGLAAAQALAHALGIDVVAVTSLELLAYGAHRAGVRGELVALVDARRHELFVQRFELGEGVVALTAPAVVAAATVLSGSSVPVTITGDGASRYRELFDANELVSVSNQDVPSVLDALELGAARSGGATAPLYLREADAVANFSTRQRP